MSIDNSSHGLAWPGVVRHGQTRHGTARAPMAHVFFSLALLAGCREQQAKPAAPPAQAARATAVARAAAPPRPMRVLRPRVVAMSPAVAEGRREVEMRPIDDAYELAVASPGDSEALHAYLDEVERMIAEAGQ